MQLSWLNDLVSTAGPLLRSLRVLFMVGSIALLLGGCLSAQDGPLEQIALDQIPRAEPAVSLGDPVNTADPGEWRLRLTSL